MRIFGTLSGIILFFLSCQSGVLTNQVLKPKFQEQELDNQLQIGYGLGIGDVDGDGKQDILLADKKQFVWYRNGDWKRFVMADSLTPKDNVCLAVRDIDGDGKVEVAVGAQWDPGETSDARESGAVFYLIRPEDPTQLWEAVPLHHEPTVHRMQWLKVGSEFQLVVLPLHGRGNQNGHGDGVQVIAYQVPKNPRENWPVTVLDRSMHITHNFDIVTEGEQESLLIGGQEGAMMLKNVNGIWSSTAGDEGLNGGRGFGEIRKKDGIVYGIKPMHGNKLLVFVPGAEQKLLTDSLDQGHALAVADLLGQGQDQVVVGWRGSQKKGDVGIKLFQADGRDWNNWQSFWIDHNGMACEDLKLADLNSDGKIDIIAAGRDTKNLKIYWNQSE